VGRGHVALSEYNVAAMAAFPTPPGERRTLDLLARIRDDDPSAWTELYDLYHDELLFTIRMNLGARLRAALESEDVLQSVALEAFQVLQRGPAPAGGFLPLLRRLVRHRLIDRARALRRHKRAGEVAMTDSAVDDLGTPPPSYSDPRYERLERALQALPADLREMIRWRRFDGLSSQQIAARTGQSDAAVRKTFSRAMARLALSVEAGP
jgi:RNA polymerase sigma-70 factor (ECF subfamily)